MKLEIEKFLEMIDGWKFKLHKRLKGMSPAQRKAFWHQVHEDARARGLNVVDPEPEKPAKQPTSRAVMNLNVQQQKAVENGAPVAVNVAGTECVVIRRDIYLRLAEGGTGPWTVEEMNLLADEAKEFITECEARVY